MYDPPQAFSRCAETKTKDITEDCHSAAKETLAATAAQT